MYEKRVEYHSANTYNTYKTFSYSDTNYANDGIVISDAVAPQSDNVVDISASSSLYHYFLKHNFYSSYNSSEFFSFRTEYAKQNNYVLQEYSKIIAIPVKKYGKSVLKNSIFITDYSVGTISLYDDGYGNIIDSAIPTGSLISTDNLLMWYSFDDGYQYKSNPYLTTLRTQDSSEFLNSMTVVNGDFEYGVSGSGYCYVLSGSSYAYTDSANYYDFNKSDFTLSAWVALNPLGGGGATEETYIYESDFTTTNGWVETPRIRVIGNVAQGVDTALHLSGSLTTATNMGSVDFPTISGIKANTKYKFKFKSRMVTSDYAYGMAIALFPSDTVSTTLLSPTGSLASEQIIVVPVSNTAYDWTENYVILESPIDNPVVRLYFIFSEDMALATKLSRTSIYLTYMKISEYTEPMGDIIYHSYFRYLEGWSVGSLVSVGINVSANGLTQNLNISGYEFFTASAYAKFPLFTTIEANKKYKFKFKACIVTDNAYGCAIGFFNSGAGDSVSNAIDIVPIQLTAGWVETECILESSVANPLVRMYIINSVSMDVAKYAGNTTLYINYIDITEDISVDVGARTIVSKKNEIDLKFPFSIDIYNSNGNANFGKFIISRQGYRDNVKLPLISITSSNALSDYTYHHICLTKNSSSNEFKFYIDGNLDTTFSDYGSRYDVQNASHIFLGAYGDDTVYGANTSSMFYGRIDDFRMYGSVVSASDLYDYSFLTNVVGSVFYEKGIIALNNLSGSYSGLLSDVFTLQYKSISEITEHEISVKKGKHEFNATMNPSLRINNSNTIIPSVTSSFTSMHTSTSLC